MDTLNAILAAGQRGDAVEYFMTSAVGVPAQLVAAMRAGPYWAGMEAVAGSLPYDGRVVDGFVLRPDRLADITIPVLVIDGDASFGWLRAAADAVAGALALGRRETLAGQEHRVDPRAIAPVLTEFLLAEED